jgi:hypothetical protein
VRHCGGTDDTISSYVRWLVETQTPLVFAGIAILAIAPSRLSPTTRDRAAMRLLALLTLTTWTVYAAYPRSTPGGSCVF